MKLACVAFIFLSSLHVCAAVTTSGPTPLQTPTPTPLPTSVPTPVPTVPTALPTPLPTALPTLSPSPAPSVTPSPTFVPTSEPTHTPTSAPTLVPTLVPSLAPTHIPTSLPSPAPSLPTAVPASQPTPLPTAQPTPRPSHIPTPLPSGTPQPSTSYDPTPLPTQPPTPRPSRIPTSVPTSLPTEAPVPNPTVSTKPTTPPTGSPTPLPTAVPTTAADFFPKYHVTMLVRCTLPSGNQAYHGGTQVQGAGNHTYGLSLKAQVGPSASSPTGMEYQTDPEKTIFHGLGRVDSKGQPVDYDAYNFTNGDLSCAVDEGGGDKMAALIHDYPLGSATALDFKNQNGDGLSTQADSDYELTQVCLEQFTSGKKPGAGTWPGGFSDGHQGVSVDVIVQRFDVSGTNTFVANETLMMYQLNPDSDDPQDPGERCVTLHPLDYQMKLGGWSPKESWTTNETEGMLMQNGLPWEMTLKAEFDAEISLLAFPWDDNSTDRRDRAELTMKHGEYLVSLQADGSYIKNKGHADHYFESSNRGRKIEGYAIATAYEARRGGKSGEGEASEICDPACQARGGEYKSWQPHVVIQWNVTKGTQGNLNSFWGDVESSTWGNPLKVRDERRYFAVSYDKTPPSVEIVASSVKFTYSNNVTKCGNSHFVPGNAVDSGGGELKNGPPTRYQFPNSFPYYTEPSLPDNPVPAGVKTNCLPTSTEDTLEFNFTANEEGTYYFYAHPAFDREGLEGNFSWLLGAKWPYSIKNTGLYTSRALCDTNSNAAETSACDTVGSFPRTERILVPMDAEAFIFGYDFSFSEFAVYAFAEDDGYCSEHEGYLPGTARGFDAFQATYGNLSYPLLSTSFVSELMTDDDPDSANPEDVVSAELADRANYYNESFWQGTRYLINSAKDSNLSKVVELVPDEVQGFTTEFGRRAQIHVQVSKYADEFDYTSHRSKFYRGRLHQEFYAKDEGGSIYTKKAVGDDFLNEPVENGDELFRSDVRSYYTNTDSLIAYERSIGRGQSQYISKGADQPFIRMGYRLERGNSSDPDKQLQTVFVMDSSDKTEAIASSDPSGKGQAAIIFGLNLTTGFSGSSFFMVGQNDGKADGDKQVKAQLRLLYSNDPLFQFVPVDSVTEVPIWNLEYSSLLPDKSSVLDATGWSPSQSLPVMNVTAKNNVDYTTDAGGLCTLLVSLSEQPTGWVKFNVGVPDKSQAQLHLGKTPVLLFSPSNYRDLEVTLQGLDDHDNSNGDVAFDVVFALASTEDARFANRYDEFNFATTLTNLATTDDVRLAIGFNATFCQTTEKGGWCDVELQVCAHGASSSVVVGADGKSTLNCNDRFGSGNDGGFLSAAPFSKLPIFTSGVDKVTVDIQVSNRFESEISAVTGNGRFDASASSVSCEPGERGGKDGELLSGCTATVVFAPFSEDSGDKPWQGHGQGPYIAFVRLTGVDDFLVDGLQDNVLNITAASVVRGREKTNDFVLYQETQVVKNVDDDTSTVRLGGNRGGAFAPSRYLQVTPASCSTSESEDVGPCQVSVEASFELLNMSVTTEFDTVACAKVSLDLTWYFDNTTTPQAAVSLLTRQITRPIIQAGAKLDYYGLDPHLRVADTYTTDGTQPYTLDGWEVADIRYSPGKAPFPWEGRSSVKGVPNMAYRAREDFCLPPGHIVGFFANASTLYVPEGSEDGGWVASIFVTGTDTVLWSSLGLPNKPSEAQLGNFSFEVPTAGVPIVLQGSSPVSLKVSVVLGDDTQPFKLFNDAVTSEKAVTNYGATSVDNKTWSTFACAATCAMTFDLNAFNDDVDDADETYSVTVAVENVVLGTPSPGESVITLSDLSSKTVLPVTHYDDDTAGLLLEAVDSPALKAYRNDLKLPSDSKNQGHRFFGMAHNTTSEGYTLDMYGDPLHRNLTSFNVSLTSQPRHDVTVTVKAQPVQNAWGWQFEGVPAEGYVVKSYESPSPWIKGTNDSVVDPWRGGLELVFTSMNWAVPRPVVVWGLDDFLDDGDRDYTVTLEAASSDKYYDSGDSMDGWGNMSKLEQEQYPRTDAYLPKVTVPLRNLDDDKASFVALQNGTRCSEPFHDLDAGIQLYLTSKPANVVSVFLQSSDPNEAGPAQELVAITPDNWETLQDVRVKSVDDFEADGNVNFTVTVDLLHSYDAQYSDAAMFARMFEFVSVDDPNDGAGMSASVVMAVDTAAPSSKAFTTALGGGTTLNVWLSYQPQAPVYVAVTTSNLKQAVVSSASMLVFTSENYAAYQPVTVVGVDDGDRSGDTFYQILLGLEGTEDPYYNRFAFSARDKTVAHNVLSQDYPWARVRLAMGVDSATTKEDDSATGTFSSLTVGLCEAIYAPVEVGGVVGEQVGELVFGSATYGTATDLCGGYWLDAEDLFGTAANGEDEDEPFVSFVAATVKVSDTSEAVLSCDPSMVLLADNSCEVSWDGKSAVLVFALATYPDLSSFAAQLRVYGVNDFAADGDTPFQVEVESAKVRYAKETHAVLEAFLPDPLSLVNLDDDQTEQERNAWYTVSPAVGCAVFEEAPADARQRQRQGAKDNNCVLDFSFHNAMKRGLGGEKYAFAVTVDVSSLAGSGVYLEAVPNISQGLHWNSSCELGTPGCTSLTLTFEEGENDFTPKDVPFKKLSLLDNPDDPLIRFGNMSASISLATVDNSWDDGDKPFQVTTDGQVGYNCTNGTLFEGCGVFVDSGNLTYTVEGTEYDDDTAGVVFSQTQGADEGNVTFYALRTGRGDGTDKLFGASLGSVASVRTVSLPDNVTSESGRETVAFLVKLSSAPSEDVTVALTTEFLDDEWGEQRVEGVPTRNASLADGGGYKVAEYKSAALWLNSSGAKDYVTNKETGRLLLTFTPRNWNETQEVVVVGLDDLAADGDLEYNLFAQVNGSAADQYGFAPSGFEVPVRFPLVNLDDEQATPGWWVKQYGFYVGEPFFGWVGRIEFRPLTEPSDVILLSFSSNKPWVANTSETLVAITPSDWDQTKTVYVTAVDNFEDDGNIGFTVEMLMLGSSDQQYGALIQNETFSFVKVDDPEDSVYGQGVGMEFQFGKNLYGVVQTFTTEYGGDGAMLDDVAKTGSATVQARLLLKPQDSVTYAVSVSDTSEAQVLYPSTVAFTPSNWDQYQEVVVLGRSDGLADGDVDYRLEFSLLGTNDPYYRVLSLNDTSFTLTNQDTIEQRLALGISSLGCYNLTEGDAFSRGFQVSGDAACTVTVSLCLSDTEGCTKKLTAQEVYNTSENLGVDSIEVWARMGDRKVARLAAPTSNFGQMNVTNNGTEARVSLGVGKALETAFNLSVFATDDHADERSEVSTHLTFFGVLKKGGKVVQEFVDYYDDFGDVTTVGTFEMGGSQSVGPSVRMGSVTINTRDDETPRLVFFKTVQGCNTGEYGRVNTPGLAVSDGTCVVYLRLGSRPNFGSGSGGGQVVEVEVSSSRADAGLFAMSYEADLTDTVDLADAALPSSFTGSFKVNFTVDDWDAPVKVVLVGQDDTDVEGNQYYELSAAVTTSGDSRYASLAAVALPFWNQEDDTNAMNVTQFGSNVGARTAKGVDEAGTVAGACRAFTVVVSDELWVDNWGDSSDVSSTLTVATSDATEGLVGLRCDPMMANNYAASVSVGPNSTDASLYNDLAAKGKGAVFYYIGVDDDDSDGDVEFSITVTLDRPAYLSGGLTVAAATETYEFFVTTYDDDYLLLANPLVDGEREFKLSTDLAAGDHALRLLEPASCPAAGECADECADAQASGQLYESISCSEKVDSSDPSKPSNRTGKLSFSYPNAATWNETDFEKMKVTFNFSANVGRFQLKFAAKGDEAANSEFTNCDSAMNDYDTSASKSCWVVLNAAHKTFFVYVTAVADDVDRGDFVDSYVDVITQLYFKSSASSSATFASEVSLATRPAARAHDGDVITKEARSQRVTISIVEDDLAGFTLNQTKGQQAGGGGGGYEVTAYRSGARNDEVQDSLPTIASITLPAATTKEAGGNVSFSLSLTSQPLVGASVYVWAEQVARTDGSETRYEGIPWPSSYQWSKYHPPRGSDWARKQVEDVVELASGWGGASKTLSFTTENWQEAQEVTIVGLNDFYDDSTVAYTIYLTTVSSDPVEDPWFGLVGQVTLPLENTDDDEAGLGAYWDDYSTGPAIGIVSEPYFGYDATLFFFLKSKPTDTVLVTLVSSAPSEAMSALSVAAIGPSDWDTPRASNVFGVDDRILDGAQNFTISVSVVYSGDSDYGDALANEDGVEGRMSVDMDGYSLDDPTDQSATACGLGELGTYGNPVSNCSACKAGTYGDVVGDKVACRQCPPGTFGAYQGSQALTSHTDFDGTPMPPGCLPCPNGTYSAGFGATACLPCPAGKHCWPVATVTPKAEMPWQKYAGSFDRRWSQVSSTPFKANVKSLAGGADQEMNRDQYEAYLIVCGLAAWLLLSVLVLAFYLLAPNRWQDGMKRGFRRLDLYARKHEERAKNEERAEDAHAPSALGGVISLGVVTLGALTTILLVYVYVHFNTVAVSSLDVYNSSFVEKVKTDLSTKVTFVGFSGCNNDTYLPASVGESTVPEMVVTGASFEKRTASYQCNDGDLDLRLMLEGLKVETNPKIAFSVKPHCSECVASTGLQARHPGNVVLECPPCTVASAQAFKYWIKATNMHGEAPGLHAKDDNFVNGSEVPPTKTESFRGSEPTEVKVRLMPADYENRRTAKTHRSYRLVYAETELGGTQGFKGATDFYGIGGAGGWATPANFFRWVKDGSWVAEGAVNEVKFTLDLPLATSRLNVVVDNAKTFLDLWAQVGGVLGLLTAIFLLAMNYLERAHDRKDPIGSLWHEVLSWVYRQRKELHEKWYPEPESWTMSNINKMQRREERREGGARKVEDGALSNFKDLYSRNAVTAVQTEGDVEEFVDEEDVDMGVF